MAKVFKGKWRLEVIKKNADFEQRFRVSNAASGNGIYPGVVGTYVDVEGDSWNVTLEWNDGSDSGWQESAVLHSEGSLSPVVLVHFLNGEDNFPDQWDNDYDDLVIMCTNLDPIFTVVQRPFALDRGTLTMLPDGIFDASQGIHYMGVRIRNTWDFDWGDFMHVMIGISNTSRTELTSQGIQVLDTWSNQEQEALQQEVINGFVQVPCLRKDEETMVYFKLNLRNASPGKPVIKFVAQRSAWDPAYDEPTRQVEEQIFVSRSTYNPASRELIAETPEATVYLRLNKLIVDRESLKKSIQYSLRHPCHRQPPRPGRRKQAPTQRSQDDLRERLKIFLENLLAEKPVDPCELRAILEACCQTGYRLPGRSDGEGKQVTKPGEGGLAEGPGSDDWCRFKPFNWLPLEFEYRIVPHPPYTGQFGPLAFEDPWWKVLLLLLAILLGLASTAYDYIFAGQDPNFVIGNIIDKSYRKYGSNIDAAIASLNGSRGLDLNVLEAQSDDRNNNLPINGSTGGTISIDRTDNSDRGIMDPVLGNVVFKSGARSGTTRGEVVDITLNKPVNGINYTNQVLVKPLNPPNNQLISQDGDSGSLWIDLSNLRPVALNFAGPKDDSGIYGMGNPIRDVVKLFDLHFNV